MAISREDLKNKRLKALGVVGVQMDATSDMYDRVIAAGQKVVVAREAAETAQMAAIDDQVADLNELAEEFAEFTNGTPTPGGTSGTASSIAAGGSALDTVNQSYASEALKTLNAAQPPALSKDAWTKGDAYVGTHGEVKS